MAAKREQARERAKHARAIRTAPESPDTDIIPWLRALGFTVAQAKLAAERSGVMPDASLEERVRAALSQLSPGRVIRPARAMV
jgi:hypothetical protein